MGPKTPNNWTTVMRRPHLLPTFSVLGGGSQKEDIRYLERTEHNNTFSGTVNTSHCPGTALSALHLLAHFVLIPTL